MKWCVKFNTYKRKNNWQRFEFEWRCWKVFESNHLSPRSLSLCVCHAFVCWYLNVCIGFFFYLFEFFYLLWTSKQLWMRCCCFFLLTSIKLAMANSIKLEISFETLTNVTLLLSACAYLFIHIRIKIVIYLNCYDEKWLITDWIDECGVLLLTLFHFFRFVCIVVFYRFSSYRLVIIVCWLFVCRRFWYVSVLLSWIMICRNVNNSTCHIYIMSFCLQWQQLCPNVFFSCFVLFSFFFLPLPFIERVLNGMRMHTIPTNSIHTNTNVWMTNEKASLCVSAFQLN